MDVVGSYNIVQDTEAITRPGFEQPVPPATTVFPELQQEFLLVTAVRDVPDISRQKIAIRSRHDASSLKHAFLP